MPAPQNTRELCFLPYSRVSQRSSSFPQCSSVCAQKSESAVYEQILTLKRFHQVIGEFNDQLYFYQAINSGCLPIQSGLYCFTTVLLLFSIILQLPMAIYFMAQKLCYQSMLSIPELLCFPLRILFFILLFCFYYPGSLLRDFKFQPQ